MVSSPISRRRGSCKPPPPGPAGTYIPQPREVRPLARAHASPDVRFCPLVRSVLGGVRRSRKAAGAALRELVLQTRFLTQKNRTLLPQADGQRTTTRIRWRTAPSSLPCGRRRCSGSSPGARRMSSWLSPGRVQLPGQHAPDF